MDTSPIIKKYLVAFSKQEGNVFSLLPPDLLEIICTMSRDGIKIKKYIEFIYPSPTPYDSVVLEYKRQLWRRKQYMDLYYSACMATSYRGFLKRGERPVSEWTPVGLVKMSRLFYDSTNFDIDGEGSIFVPAGRAQTSDAVRSGVGEWVWYVGHGEEGRTILASELFWSILRTNNEYTFANMTVVTTSKIKSIGWFALEHYLRNDLDAHFVLDMNRTLKCIAFQPESNSVLTKRLKNIRLANDKLLRNFADY